MYITYVQLDYIDNFIPSCFRIPNLQYGTHKCCKGLGTRLLLVSSITSFVIGRQKVD